MRYIRKLANRQAIQAVLNDFTYDNPYVCLDQDTDTFSWNDLKPTLDAGRANSTIVEHTISGGGAAPETVFRTFSGEVSDACVVYREGKRNLW